MSANRSVSLDATAFTALVRTLTDSGRADLFLSGAGRADETRCVIGFGLERELRLTADSTRETLDAFCFDAPGPVLGFVSYTYGLILRGVPSDKPSDFPLGHLKRYGAVLEYDLATGVGTIDGPNDDAVTELNTLIADARAASEEAAPEGSAPSLPVAESLPAFGPVQQDMTQHEYEERVRRTLEAIRDGQTYQLNLSLPFTRPAPDMGMARSDRIEPQGLPTSDTLMGRLFVDLWQRRPAPFYTLFGSGPFTILSSSPERFLRVTDGEVLSQPIKGTLCVDEGDEEGVRQLTDSPKESAELSMIVDLIRNDISHHCEYGSVRVCDHKSVFRVDNLLQMYSNVRGRLRAGATVLDLFLDAFPGGSITGCPKRRSMELIEELEPHARDIYCGSFVVIRGPRDMDSSIAIRTAWRDARDGQLTFMAGSGIVVDSDPHREYLESVAKAEKFLNLGGA